MPVVKELAETLEEHRDRMGKLAVGPIFQSGNGSPLNLDNLARRAIIPAIEKCVICRQSESEHKPEGHVFQLDKSLSVARLARFPPRARNEPSPPARGR